MVITNAVLAALLSKPLISCTDTFMKNKGGVDGIKPLKETKQWNTWQCTFLSIACAYDIKDVTSATYVPNPMDYDTTKVYKLQQKHAFRILVANVKQSSVLPVICCYSDPNTTDYGDAQMLYQNCVSQYTQGLTG